MLKKFVYYSCLLLLCIQFSDVNAQYTNFNTQKNWSQNKKEFLFAFGATQFTGDLGGRDRIGKDFSMVDIDFPSTSINGLIGFRYRFHPFFTTVTTLQVGKMKGSDSLTNEVIRESRNLHFKSNVFELTQRLEFILFSNEKYGARYIIPGRKGAKNRSDRLYAFSGVGVNYFNPKALYQGKWVPLDPLNTEGQGMEGGARETLPFSLTIPFGIGYRVGVSRMWRIGIEASYIKTFTDYMDDVSTVYYDPGKLGSAEAQYLSNPANNNTNWFAPGQQRGDKNKDAYYYLNLTIAKNLTYKSYGKLGGRGYSRRKKMFY
jgi:hypothetical protein